MYLIAIAMTDSAISCSHMSEILVLVNVSRPIADIMLVITINLGSDTVLLIAYLLPESYNLLFAHRVRFVFNQHNSLPYIQAIGGGSSIEPFSELCPIIFRKVSEVT